MVEALFAHENYTAAVHLLDAATMRHQALASNIANTQTPGYQRVDLDPSFRATMAQAMERNQLDPTAKSQQPTLAIDTSSPAVRPDGNNVTLEHELMELQRNALDHEFLTGVVSGSLKHLRTAITGRST